MFAYCYRNGDIGISESVPDGAMPLAEGEYECLYAALGCARQSYAKANPLEYGYTGWIILVPGVPEAGTEEEAYYAVSKFVDDLKRVLSDLQIQ